MWSRRLAAQKKYILNTLRGYPVDMQVNFNKENNS